MKPIRNLRDLFVSQLKDRYDSELQQIESFPALEHRAASLELKRLIQTSIAYSQRHLTRLSAIFAGLHTDPVDEVCEGSLGMISEAIRLLDRTTTPEVGDAALISSIQHIHHYDIAGYGTLSAYARALGFDEWARLLHDMLDEEKDLDIELKELAVNVINQRALKVSERVA